MDGDKSEIFCAVSSDVCSTDSGFSFLEVLELESELSVICNLCDTLTEAELHTPIGGPMKSEKSTWNRSNIAAITIGTTFGVLAIVILSVISLRKKKSTTSASKTPDFDEKSLNSVL